MNTQPFYKKIRDDIFYAFVVFLIKLMRMMPRSAALHIMRLLGNIAFIFGGNARKRTIEHLTFAFGSEKDASEIKKLARQVFVHFATAAADLVRLSKIIDAGINNIVTSEGIEHLDKAFADGKGVMMLTGHFGNWEVLGAWLIQNGYQMKVVGTSLFDPRLDKILVETRNQAGYTNIARGKGTREILRTLKSGQAIGMLIDQDTKAEGEFATFFGRPAHTPMGPVVLAGKMGLPLIPIFMHMREDFTYHVKCEPPIDMTRTDDEENDIKFNLQRCSDVYEKVIREHPEQWVWMHKRWKTRPGQ